MIFSLPSLPHSILHSPTSKLRCCYFSRSLLYLLLIKWISCENYHVMQTTHTRYIYANLDFCLLLNLLVTFFSVVIVVIVVVSFLSHSHFLYLYCWNFMLADLIFFLNFTHFASGKVLNLCRECVKCQLSQWMVESMAVIN